MQEKCSVVMLPARASNLVLVKESTTHPKKNNVLVEYERERTAEHSENFQQQHLYITCDDIFTERDYVLLPNGTVHRMTSNDMIDYLDSGSTATKMIVASTDEELLKVANGTVAGIPHYFILDYIDAYNKNCKITEVLVNYEITKYNFKMYFLHDIKPLKDNYTRKEIFKLFEYFNEDALHGSSVMSQEELQEWLGKNLV